MSEHKHLYNLLQLISLLGKPGGYPVKRLAELITDAKTSRVVSLLLEAIRHRKRVILHHYHSPSSDTVLDRAADPIGFSINMKYLYAFEPEHQKVVQFKPERIGRIEITAESFEPDERYRVKKPNLFGMSGAPRTVVSLLLNRRALHLLLEEFPESAAILEQGLTGFENLSGLQNNLKVNLPVKGVEGAGRFILGFLGLKGTPALH